MATSGIPVVPTANALEQTARRPAPGLTTSATFNARNHTARRPAPGVAFRHEDMPCLQSDKHLCARIAAFLMHGERAEELADAEVEWTECKCKLHVLVTHDDPGGAGCARLPHGTHSALQGLYGANHTACVVEPGVRKRDRELFDYAEFPTGPVRPVRKKYIAGFGTLPERMGAYYCYTHWFPDEVVVRVARLLGPEPRLHRVLRYFLLVGKRGPVQALAQEVEPGMLHVERSANRAVTPEAVVRFILGRAPNDRVGYDYAEQVREWCGGLVLNPSRGYVSGEDRARFSRLRTQCETVGMYVPSEAVVDFAYATKPTAERPVEAVDMRLRARFFEHVGDRVLKMHGSLKALVTGGDFSLARWDTASTNVNLAVLTLEEPLREVLECGALLPSSKARANLVEGLVGVLFVYCGPSVVAYLKEVGLVPAGEFEAKEVTVSDPVGGHVMSRVSAVLADFQLRGGSVDGFMEAVRRAVEEENEPAAAGQPARTDG